MFAPSQQRGTKQPARPLTQSIPIDDNLGGLHVSINTITSVLESITEPFLHVKR